MFNVSRWSIRNPVATTLLFILLTTLGLLGFNKLNIRNMPDIGLPLIAVTIAWPGAAPATLENEVVNKVEGQLTSVAGVKHTNTTVVDGMAAFLLEFALEKNIQEALEDVRAALANVRAQLPPQIREPVIARQDMSRQTLLAYAAHSATRDALALSDLVRDVIGPRLALVPGVARVTPVGLLRRELRVDLHPAAMAALGISAADISQQLRRAYSDNVAGSTIMGGREQQIRVLARVAAPLHLAQLPLPLPDGRSVRLGDIATVYDGAAERTSAAFLNGAPIIGFELAQEKKGDQIAFRQRMEAALDELQRQYPDVQFHKTLDFVEVAQGGYHSSLRLLLEGGLLTIAIVWLFLRDRRATLISALSLPLSIIPAFIGMALPGFSINIVSLLALSLVIGVLVDDTIVETENIMRHVRMGTTPMQAALDASDEIGLAVIATTLTIVAVFLPTAFMPGIGGLFFRQFGLTVVFAVLASLLVARMLTPMLAAYWIKARPEKTAAPQAEPRWLRLYLRMAHACLRQRAATLLGALLFFIASLALLPLLPKGFIPADDNDHTQITLEMPPGTRLPERIALLRDIQARLQDMAEIEHIYATLTGADAFTALLHGGASSATLTLRLAARGQRPAKAQIQSALVQRLAAVPGVRASVGLDVSNDKYQIHLVSHDKAALHQAASALEPQLRALPGIHGVQSAGLMQRAEVAVEMDFARAADLGITAADVAQTLRIATTGDYEEALAKFDMGKQQIPVRVKLHDSIRTDLAALESLLIPAPGAASPVPLKEVARLHLASGPVSLRHLDGIPSAGFTLSIGSLNMGDVSRAAAALPALQNLPTGVYIKELGDAEARAELFGSFLSAMLIGALLIYAVLVLLFKDFIQPLTLLAALPLASGGSFIAMLLAGQSFSMPVMIGFIMLMGIVSKNSILLVDYAIIAQQEHGLPRQQAVLDACRKRARPIIMTSLAMGFGMLPVALGWGDADMSFRAPMGITLVGGLVTSTLLSLLVVPTLFTCADDAAQWLRKRRTAASAERQENAD